MSEIRLLETSLYVDDVARASAFYRSLFGFEAMIEDQRFCALSVSGKQVLLLFKKGSSTSVTVVPGGNIPPHDGSGETWPTTGARTWLSCWAWRSRWRYSLARRWSANRCGRACAICS